MIDDLAVEADYLVRFVQIVQCGRTRFPSREQLAIDDVRGRHLSIPLKDGDVLVGGLAVIRVVCRVAGDRLAIGCAEVSYL